MMLAVIKFIGENTAKEAFKQFTSPGFKRLKEMLLGAEMDVKTYLEIQMQEITKSLDAIELRQIFQDYNRADEELEYMTHLYYRQADNPLDHRDRQNTCSYILDINRGVSERARRMIGSFFHRSLPAYKTFLQEYSDKLAEKYTDIYSYLDKMDTLVNHLRMNLAEAILVREKAYADIADKESVTDLALTPGEVELVDQYYDEIVGPVKSLRDTVDGLAGEKGRNVRIKHIRTGKYLTGYEEGDAKSMNEPFGPWQRTAMPQLYACELGRGQKKEIGKNTSNGWSRLNIEVKSENQDWKIIKIEEEEKSVDRGDDSEPIKLREGDKPVRLMFQLNAGGKVLDGIDGGRVYLGERNKDNRHLWWVPIMSRDGRGKFEPGVFLLKHFHTGFALDSNGSRVYADDHQPGYGNDFMKWRLDQKNVLEGDEFLNPGEKLVSPNRGYELRLQETGNLELSDSSSKKVLWDTKTAGKGAVKCIMQKDDGHLVMYDRENKAVWASQRRGSVFAGSKLVLRDDGFFEIINKHNVSFYDTKWALTRESINALGPDEYLVPGDRLISENQRFVLRFVESGNLELFDREDKKVLWDNKLAGKGAVRCGMQQDTGRFVAYDKADKVVWHNNPWRKTKDYAGKEIRLSLKDNGTLSVTAGSLSTTITLSNDVEG